MSDKTDYLSACMAEQETPCLAGPVVLSLALLHRYCVEIAMIYSLSLCFKMFAMLGCCCCCYRVKEKLNSRLKEFLCGGKQKGSRKMKIPVVQLVDLQSYRERRNLSISQMKL